MKARLTRRRRTRGTPTVRPEIVLPTTRTTPMKRILDFTHFIYGEKKIGKTSLINLFGRCLFMACEVGYKGLSVFHRDIFDWPSFKDHVEVLMRQGNQLYDVVCIDTADRAFKLCTKWVCEKLGIQHLSDVGFGKAYDMAAEEFLGETNRLMSKFGVVFISHIKMDEVKKWDETSYNKAIPTIMKTGRELLEGVVDLWGCYRYEGQDRVLTIVGDEYFGAGHRIDKHFMYPDGSQIRNIPMGRSAEEAYHNFSLGFENKLSKGGLIVPKNTPVKSTGRLLVKRR